MNKWIRESGAFDGVIDFDIVVRDPNRPSYIQAAYDSGDHLHPNDAGYKAMAESIDLEVADGATPNPQTVMSGGRKAWARCSTYFGYRYLHSADWSTRPGGWRGGG